MGTLFLLLFIFLSLVLACLLKHSKAERERKKWGKEEKGKKKKKKKGKKKEGGGEGGEKNPASPNHS